jgi:P27 family predicted phage terminase small subunit
MNLGRALEAEKKMKKEGAVIKVQTKQGSMQMVSPWFKVQKDCISAASAIAQQFGLTPVSRMRIAQMLQPKQEEKDPFAEFD